MSPKAARPFHRYRYLVSLLILLLVLLGLYSIGRIPSDQLHARISPVLRVTVSVPGVVPSIIEEIITRPAEQAFSGIKGIQSIDSNTGPGRTILNLRLEQRRDIRTVSRDLAGQLDRIRSSWPTALEPPVVSLVDDASLVEEFLVTSRQRDLLALRDWTEGEFAVKLREIPGIATVVVAGGTVRVILVIPDQRRLAGYGLGFGDILSALGRNPVTKTEIIPSTETGWERQELVLTGDVEAVAAAPVILPSGESVPLSEIARIRQIEEKQTSLPPSENSETVRVSVLKQPDIALSIISARIQAHVDWMRANRLIPEGIDIQAVSGKSTELRVTIRKMAYALVGAILLIFFIALLFLGSLRRAVILGSTVVCSLLSVFVIMMWFDLALDVVTLGGLTLGSGLFATTAMVLLQGKPSREDDITYIGVVSAAVALAVPASLLSLLFTKSGSTSIFLDGMLIFCIAWISASLLACLLIATFDRRMLRKDRAWNALVSHVMARMRLAHNRLLRQLLRFPYATLTFLMLFSMTVTALIYLGRPDVVFDQQPTGKIVLRIQGPEFTRLSEIGLEIHNRLRQLPGTREVSYSAASLIEMPVLQMNEERARELGISIIEAGRALAIGTSGIYAGSFRDAEHRYDVRLGPFVDKAKRSPEPGRFLLRGELDDQSAIYLQDVATVDNALVPAQLLRHNGNPAVEIAVSSENETVASRLLNQIRVALKNYPLPSGYHLSYVVPGEIAVNFGTGLQDLGWALLGILIVTALICRSLYIASLVTLSACLGLIGAASALLLFGLPASPDAWLAARILIGITASYTVGTMLYLRVLARRGIVLRTLITRSARQLFRPLLAMSLLGILGMLPLMGLYTESVNFQPFFIIIATGLVFSFIAASLVVFLLYFIFPAKIQ